MSAQVRLAAQSGETALAVPTEAVIRTGKRSLVIAVREHGRFEPVEVELGPEIDDRTVIVAGLAEGQRIVSSAQFLLDSEASLSGLFTPPRIPRHVPLPHDSTAAPHQHDAGHTDGRTAMIAAVIRWSLGNRFLVVLASVFLAGWGLWAVRTTPVDALPDLSDVQVIIRTSFPGQAPQIVEDQVTYPLTSTMLSVPGAKTVRGFSFYGDSFVYVLFEDGTDLYWARSRVLEYLNQVQEPTAGHGAIGARPRRHRRGLDLPVRADRSQRRARSLAVARAAGLVPALRAEDAAQCRRGRHHRRHGQSSTRSCWTR